MQKPTPINEEIVLDPDRFIVSKTDTRGFITYANDYFVEICKYTKEELKGVNHNIIRHPDMPRVAFKAMWDRIPKGETFKAIVKNLAKDGRYYWVFASIEPNHHPVTGEIVSYTAYRKAAPRKAIEAIVPIYEQLLEKEAQGGLKASEEFLVNYLRSNNTTYNDFIEHITETKGKKSLFGFLKKFFAKKSW